MTKSRVALGPDGMRPGVEERRVQFEFGWWLGGVAQGTGGGRLGRDRGRFR
jgi:hypothetical protein